MDEKVIQGFFKEQRIDFHAAFDRLEKKIDETNNKLDSVNDKAIANETNINNIKDEIAQKTLEFHRLNNITHKVIRNCKTDHEKCPEKIKSDAIMETKNWFYATWVIGGAAFLLALMKEHLTK